MTQVKHSVDFGVSVITTLLRMNHSTFELQFCHLLVELVEPPSQAYFKENAL